MINRPRRGTFRTREPWVGEEAIPRLTAHVHTWSAYLSLPPVSYEGRGLVGRMSVEGGPVPGAVRGGSHAWGGGPELPVH